MMPAFVCISRNSSRTAGGISCDTAAPLKIRSGMSGNSGLLIVLVHMIRHLLWKASSNTALSCEGRAD